jgi:non-canonical (house-cleaning) NTP pyrophosphatase
MIIALGSTSPRKVGALQDALAAAEVKASVRALPSPSGVNEQPFGANETACGAFNQAAGALARAPECDYAIGVESGIIETMPGEWVDAATVVIVYRGPTKQTELAALTTSVGVPMPKKYVRMCVLAGPRSHTVGEFYAAACGGDKTDITTTMTGGKLTRQGLLADAIYAALVMAGITGAA